MLNFKQQKLLDQQLVGGSMKVKDYLEHWEEVK